MYSTIELYEPATAPAVPSVVIGRARISQALSNEIGEQIKSKRGRCDIQLRRLPPVPAGDIADKAKGKPEQPETIKCEAVRAFKVDAHSYTWRVVVPKAADRAKMAAQAGEWEG